MSLLVRADAPAKNRSSRYTAACGCQMPPSQFLQMVEDWARQAGADLPWTTPRPLVQPLHWTCAAQGLQRALLEGGGAAPLLASATAAAGAPAEAPHAGASALRRRPSRQADGDGVDTALLGGRIFTSDPRHLWCEALAIRDGCIAAVGTVAEIEALCGPRTEVFELDGRVVIPGFNDAHMHHTPDPTGVRLPIDPVADPPFADVARLIAEAVASTPTGTWIYGVMGTGLINDRSVDRHSLDQVAPQHPVILLGLTNHTNVVNTMAMARLGIEEEAPDPLGGSFDRLPGSRRVSGRIHEYAQWAPQRCFASMATVEEGAASLRALAEACARFGITTVQNMSWTPAERYLEMLKAADPAVRVRLIRFPPSGPQGRVLHEGAGLPRTVGDRIRVSGTKWILDGTTVERAAALGRPYADDPSTDLGIREEDFETIAEYAVKVYGDGRQLEALGPLAAAEIVNIYRATAGQVAAE